MAESHLMRISPPSTLRGEVVLPGDKSISHRAAILNSLTEGKAVIDNFAPGRDCLSTLRCLKALGVKTKRTTTPESCTVIVWGSDGFKEPANVLNAGNSATTMRLLGGLLSCQPFLSIITGDASLRSRPMRRLIEPLRLMGAQIWGRGEDSFAPLVIKGKQLRGIEYTLPIPSAQVKSAILLAALFAQGKTVIHQPVLCRDHTERMLEQMGADIRREGTVISVNCLSRPLNAVTLRVPGDISSAAYFLVAGAIHPHAAITIKDCGINPTRTGIIDVLTAMGAKLRIGNQRWQAGEPLADIEVESSELKGIEIGGEIIPRLIDEIPILAVAGCVARGKTVIRDAAELRVKESDRIATVSAELSRLGARIETLPDGMIIHGGQKLRGNEVDSHLDHRVAMSLAVAALVAEGETTIRRAYVTEVSYPGFQQNLLSLMDAAERAPSHLTTN
jgi:3-phosphoshikimate 1-carboxyvinyltransferase